MIRVAVPFKGRSLPKLLPIFAVNAQRRTPHRAWLYRDSARPDSVCRCNEPIPTEPVPA
jgi:hypothetical protein